MTDTQAGSRRSLDKTKSLREKENKQAWLDAWVDPVADVKAFSSCVTTCNLLGDGDWRLVVADTDRKLKVHKYFTHAHIRLAVAAIDIIPRCRSGKAPTKPWSKPCWMIL
jgi:hypothetical protein